MRDGSSVLSLPVAVRGLALPQQSPVEGAAAPAWRPELDRVARRYHRTGAWVAALLNPLFALNDLVVLPTHALSFLLVRCGVTAIIVIVLRMEPRWKLDPRQLVMVPFLLISLENAWMWSFMDAPLFRMHSLAYAVLFLGASMIVLWPVAYSLVVLAVTLAANALFLSLHTPMSLSQVMANGGTMMAAIAVISIVLAHTRYRTTIREIVLRLRLEEANAREREQKVRIETAHRDLTSSIRCSQRIQQAILPGGTALNELFERSFLLARPKDIVSGDFLWCVEVGGMRYVAVADCTGHGVPGALMSMLGHSLLNRIVAQDGVREPAAILTRLRQEIIAAQRRGGGQENADGMDIALCALDPSSRMLSFAGAFNPAIIVRNGTIVELEADRMPIGILASDAPANFEQRNAVLRAGDMLYLFSDGFADQFGGPQHRKLGRKRFHELLISLAPLDTALQRTRLSDALARWQGDASSVDDVMVVGIRC